MSTGHESRAGKGWIPRLFLRGRKSTSGKNDNTPTPMALVSQSVHESRKHLIELARHGKLRCGIESEFGYWKPEPFRAAKIVPVSTWALKLGGLASCAVCGKSLKDEVSVSHGCCANHADWRIVWVHHSWSGAELNNSMADQLERMVRQYEAENQTNQEEQSE